MRAGWLAIGWAFASSVSFAQYFPTTARELQKLNRSLQGQVVDLTQNHGNDARLPSEVLGQCRDLYIYLPPGYNPQRCRYPLVIWCHGSFGDEAAFIRSCELQYLDQQIAAGKITPMIVACPDGTIEGKNKWNARHSFFVNGHSGRFEDHLIAEVLPFLEANFAVHPDRAARAIVGVSAGGYGAMSIALRRSELFGAAATLAAPINMRYWNDADRYFKNFDPDHFQWREHYNPKETIGRYFLLVPIHAGPLIEPVFGPADCALANIVQTNPADLITDPTFAADPVRIYLNYPKHDNFNFDAHTQSFAWLARGRGLCVEVEEDKNGQHLVQYFLRNTRRAYHWLSTTLPGPLPIELTTEGAVPQ